MFKELEMESYRSKTHIITLRGPVTSNRSVILRELIKRMIDNSNTYTLTNQEVIGENTYANFYVKEKDSYISVTTGGNTEDEFITAFNWTSECISDYWITELLIDDLNLLDAFLYESDESISYTFIDEDDAYAELDEDKQKELTLKKLNYLMKDGLGVFLFNNK